MKLGNKSIAILIANGFEQSEMEEPKKALENEGAKVTIISPEVGKVKGWKDGNWAKDISIDLELDQANPEDFSALVLPGGVMNPDKLRINEKAIKFIKHFVDTQKPIAAICHGPWTLIDAGGVKNHKITSWPSLKVDLINAGAEWVDEEVVKDKKLITSRKPQDLPAFNKNMIELFAE